MRVSFDTLTSADGEAVHKPVSSAPLLPSKLQDPPDRQRAGVVVPVDVLVDVYDGVLVLVDVYDGVLVLVDVRVEVTVPVCERVGVPVPVCELEGVPVPVSVDVGVRVPVCELEAVPVALDDDVPVPVLLGVAVPVPVLLDVDVDEGVGELLTRWHTRTLSTSSCELPLASPTFLTRNTSSYEPVADTETVADECVHEPSV